MNPLTLWQRYQDWLYYHEGLQFYLDISRMGVDEAFLEKLKPKFDKAFQDMKNLEAGGIANPDEKRMVGHYWLRNPEIAPTAAIKQEIIQALDDIELFVRQVHTGAIKPPKAPNPLQDPGVTRILAPLLHCNMLYRPSGQFQRSPPPNFSNWRFS